jgi:hypothetical protein
MSTTTKNHKPAAPTLIVFGTPKGARAPHGAWFPAPYAERAQLAAHRQNLATVAVETEDARAAAALLKEGQLKAGGQLIMPCISQELLNRLRRLVPATPPSSPPNGRAGPTTPGVKVPAALWDTLKVTDVVLAAHLDNGLPDGWYEAVIMKIEGGIFTARWADYPEDGLVRLQRQHIALMYPG